MGDAQHDEVEPGPADLLGEAPDVVVRAQRRIEDLTALEVDAARPVEAGEGVALDHLVEGVQRGLDHVIAARESVVRELIGLVALVGRSVRRQPHADAPMQIPAFDPVEDVAMRVRGTPRTAIDSFGRHGELALVAQRRERTSPNGEDWILGVPVLDRFHQCRDLSVGVIETLSVRGLKDPSVRANRDVDRDADPIEPGDVGASRDPEAPEVGADALERGLRRDQPMRPVDVHLGEEAGHDDRARAATADSSSKGAENWKAWTVFISGSMKRPNASSPDVSSHAAAIR